MKKLLTLVLMICVAQMYAQEFVQTGEVKLTPPLINASQVLFKDSAKVYVSHPMAGVEIQCGTNTRANGRVERPVEMPLVVHSNVSVRCKATHPDFIESDVARLELRTISPTIIEVNPNSTEPSPKYSANGLETLVDDVKGNMDHTKGWLGYDVPYVEIILDMDSSYAYSYMGFSFLKNHSAWIFEPEQIEVYGDGEFLDRYDWQAPKSIQSNSTELIDCFWDAQTLRKITIRIHTTSSLPEWHSGAGLQGWFFIDEIIIN